MIKRILHALFVAATLAVIMANIASDVADYFGPARPPDGMPASALPR